MRLHIIISLKANMFLPFRHQHSTQCVLDLEISHVSVNQGLRKSDDRVPVSWMQFVQYLDLFAHIFRVCDKKWSKFDAITCELMRCVLVVVVLYYVLYWIVVEN